MANQFWVSQVNSPNATADGSAYASSTSATDVSPAPQFTIPANTLYAGQTWRVRAWGRFSTTGTPNLTLGVYYGGVSGTAIATTGTVATSSGASNLTWELDLTFVCRSTGSSGTVIGFGNVKGVSGATAVNMIPASAPATATINTTTANTLTVGATWGTSSASNTLTCHGVTVELMN